LAHPSLLKFRNPQLAALHARESGRGHRNRATLAVARKLVAYLLVVDKSRQPFDLRDSGEGRSPGRGTSIFIAVSQGDRGVL